MTRSTYAGQAASTGTALGLLQHTDLPPLAAVSGESSSADPVAEVTDAFDAVAEQLAELSRTLRASGQTDMADIVEVNGYIALDHELRGAAVRHVGEGRPPAQAVVEAVQEYAALLAALDDPTLAERAADVRQVGRRVLGRLSGGGSAGGPDGSDGPDSSDNSDRCDSSDSPTGPTGPLVLVAEEIGAADLLEHGDRVVAAASVIGGPNSHASIIARSLGIPLILGISAEALNHPAGAEALIDAGPATLVVEPDPAERQAALAAMEAARRRREVLAAERDQPARTVDGHEIALRANVATVVEAKAATAAHAEGVGLLRTELPFLDARRWPTRDQHAAVLAPILGKLTGQPVTVRTLDFADDKFPPFLADHAVDGHLGRGLPFMLADPGAFPEQFGAILRTGADCDLRIMIPMVATVEELTACAKILAAVAAEMGIEPPPIGAMIELPEAVDAAEDLAAESAFFSIGSNDLTSQILRLDRRDPAVSPALAAHPRVLEAIARTVRAAHRQGRQVSVCGDAAAHPLVIPLLIGLGVDVLSVAPAALDETRVRIRRLDARICADAAAEALTCDTVESVHRIVRQRCWPVMP